MERSAWEVTITKGRNGEEQKKRTRVEVPGPCTRDTRVLEHCHRKVQLGGKLVHFVGTEEEVIGGKALKTEKGLKKKDLKAKPRSTATAPSSSDAAAIPDTVDMGQLIQAMKNLCGLMESYTAGAGASARKAPPSQHTLLEEEEKEKEAFEDRIGKARQKALKKMAERTEKRVAELRKADA